MIYINDNSNINYIIASGILGFDGRGHYLKLQTRMAIKKNPKLFTITLKTLTRNPNKGNYIWNPRKVIKHIPFGILNAVGLKNPGIKYWENNIQPRIQWKENSLIASIYAENESELQYLIYKLEKYPFEAIEINSSCPNVLELPIEFLLNISKIANEITNKSIILKVSANQNYIQLIKANYKFISAISINSVPWNLIFSSRSPLSDFGNGALSGGITQSIVWRMIKEISDLNLAPIIGSGIWWKEDISEIRKYGARAISFGACFAHHPKEIISWVKEDLKSN